MDSTTQRGGCLRASREQMGLKSLKPNALFGRGYLEAGKMPKPGLSVITVRNSVYQRLLTEAKTRGQSISQYLESTLASGTVLGQSQITCFEPNGREAGRVGFEPTICGSAGRRLGPGSTTGPQTAGSQLFPYYAITLARACVETVSYDQTVPSGKLCSHV